MDSMCSLHTFTGLDNRMDFDLCSHAFRCHGCPKKHVVCCSSFGALKTHDLAFGKSVHVRVIVDSMGLGTGGGGRRLSHIPRFEIRSIDLHIY